MIALAEASLAVGKTASTTQSLSATKISLESVTATAGTRGATSLASAGKAAAARCVLAFASTREEAF